MRWLDREQRLCKPFEEIFLRCTTFVFAETEEYLSLIQWYLKKPSTIAQFKASFKHLQAMIFLKYGTTWEAPLFCSTLLLSRKNQFCDLEAEDRLCTLRANLSHTTPMTKKSYSQAWSDIHFLSFFFSKLIKRQVTTSIHKCSCNVYKKSPSGHPAWCMGTRLQ